MRNFHPIAQQERGVLPVTVRDPRTRLPITGREPVAVHMGLDLQERANVWMQEENEGRPFKASEAVKRYLAEDQGISYLDVLHEFLAGQTLGRVKVERFLAAAGGRPLFPPVVEDGLRAGMERVAGLWRDLIARTIPIDSTTYEFYSFTIGTVGVQQSAVLRERFGLKKVAQAGPIPVARVAVTGKSYILSKKGRGIEWTYEAARAPIDLAGLWFEQLGIQVGWDYHDEAIAALRTGWQDDGSDAPPVIAPMSGATSIDDVTDADLFYALRVFQTQYGQGVNVSDVRMITSLETAVKLLTLETAAGTGIRAFPNGLAAAGLPALITSEEVPDDHIILVDTSAALVRFVNQEWGTENDRVVQTQTEGTYGTSVDLIVPFTAEARIVIAATT